MCKVVKMECPVPKQQQGRFAHMDKKEEEEDWHEEEEKEEEEAAVGGSAQHTHTPVSLNIGRAAELGCTRRSLCNIVAARQIVQLLPGECVC